MLECFKVGSIERKPQSRRRATVLVETSCRRFSCVPKSPLMHTRNMLRTFAVRGLRKTLGVALVVCVGGVGIWGTSCTRPWITAVSAQTTLGASARGRSDAVPALDSVEITERLKQKLPGDLRFRDSRGRNVRLGDLVGDGKATLLMFAYYRCPVMCDLLLTTVAQSLRDNPWTLGKEFRAVVISIDPADTPKTAAQKRAEVLGTYGREVHGRGWHFLTGEAEAIAQAANAAGFRYSYDEQQDLFAHSAVVMFLTPAGRLSRYLYGLKLSPRDLRIALLEASEGRFVSAADKVLMYCYRYDPDASGYVLWAERVMQLGGGAMALLLFGLLAYFWRRELLRKRKPSLQVPPPVDPHQAPV